MHLDAFVRVAHGVEGGSGQRIRGRVMKGVQQKDQALALFYQSVETMSTTNASDASSISRFGKPYTAMSLAKDCAEPSPR